MECCCSLLSSAGMCHRHISRLSLLLLMVLLLPTVLSLSDHLRSAEAKHGRGRNSRIPRLPLTTTPSPILSPSEASFILKDHEGHASTVSFLQSLLQVIGLGSLSGGLEKISDGLESALPWSTLVGILGKVSLGELLANYNNAYNGWKREFNMGYCYLEYSLFHMMNSGRGYYRSMDARGPNVTFWDIYTGLMSAAQSGGSGDAASQLSNVFQSVLPMVAEMAKNPAVQDLFGPVLSSLLTNAAPVKTVTNQVEDEPEDSQSEEDDLLPPQPPPPVKQGQNNFGTMVLSLVQTYLQHYLGSLPGNNAARPPPKPDRFSEKNSTVPLASGEDMVEAICDVAKPFFISFFGVVPDISGVGRLGQVDRKDRNTRKRIKPDDILVEGNDYSGPSISLYDIFMGDNDVLPSNSNPIYNFGNRVAYAFSVANDANQGLYCMKQYSVNKLWDWFRVGVAAVVR